MTFPPSQPVVGLRLHHLQLLPAVALWCLMVEMRLAAVSWQSKNCLLRYSRPKLTILIKMCCGGSAVLEWAVSFQTLFHVPPPDPLPGYAAGSHIIRLLLSHPLRVGYGVLAEPALHGAFALSKAIAPTSPDLWEPRVLLRGDPMGTSEF